MRALDWFGNVPDNWTVSRLKYLGKFASGENITGESITPEGDYPVYGGNGLRGYTSSFTHDGSFVLVGRQGALCGNVNYASGQFWASEHAVVVTPAAGVHLRWLGHLLAAMDLRQYSMSAAQPGLSVEYIANLSAPCPPKDIQHIIGKYLDFEMRRIDELIHEKERMLELLAEKRTALVTQTVMRGLDSKVRLKRSKLDWLDVIPAHWNLVRLKFLATVRTGLTIGKDYGVKELSEYYYLRVANVQDGYLDLSDVTKVLVPESEAAGCLLKMGDVLMNEGGDIDKLGRGCVWKAEIEPCLHQNHVFAVRPHSVGPEWLAMWTSTLPAKSYFEQRAKRTTNLASISSTNIKELSVPLPPPTEQKAILAYIAEATAHFDDVKATTVRSIGLLRERRSAVITAAVTGQLSMEEMAP